MYIALLVKDFAVGEKFLKDGLPTKSGAEFHAENHAKELIRRGHHVTIFTRKRHYYTKARENLDGIDLVRLHEPFRGAELVLRLLTTHRGFDTVYIIGTPKFAVWAIRFAQWLKKPVTLALTGKAEIFDAGASWRNRIFSTCTQYLALSMEIQRGFSTYGGIDPRKITVLGQGINTQRFQPPSKEEKTALRKKHQLAANAKVLVFCARLVPDKGTAILQTVWPLIHEAFPLAHFFIVGGGRHDIVDALRQLSYQTDQSVTVVGEVDSPAEYYRMADVNIFPSRHEGLPTSLMEAMSCGLPSVVSDIGGCEDLVTDGVNGFRVPMDAAEAFTHRVMELFRDEGLCKRMGEAAAFFVGMHCDYGRVIARLEEILTRKISKLE